MLISEADFIQTLITQRMADTEKPLEKSDGALPPMKLYHAYPFRSLRCMWLIEGTVSKHIYFQFVVRLNIIALLFHH